MSAIIPETFRQEYGLSEIYNIVNSLSVSYLDFAIESRYYNRMFGVTMPCDGDCDDGDFHVNSCLRESLWRTILAIQEQTENYVGYNFTDRYHTEIIEWTFRDYYKTAFPGISAIDIIPQWSTIAGATSVSFSPFIAEGLTPTVAGGYTYVAIPSFVGNPNEVVLRSSDTNGIYVKLQDRNFPRRVGDTWEIAIDIGITAYDGEPINAMHCKYAFVDVDLEDLVPCEDGVVYPVYPNTNQIIPQARPYETPEVGVRRYWFYLYTLVDPVFEGQIVDLEQNDFYALLTEIEFRCLTEVSQKGILTKTCDCNDPYSNCNCEDTVYQVSVTIDNAAMGIVSFCVDGKFNDDDELIDLAACEKPLLYDGSSSYQLIFSYKTSPDFLPVKFKNSINILRRAMMHRIAAELPVRDCCCELKKGFIFEQQRTYGTEKTNPFTSEVSMSFKYGDMHGQRVYADLLSTVPLFKVTVV